jgi:lipopolysaccharide/colanic/teichoic acid biosynthesis glycosyltransferase
MNYGKRAFDLCGAVLALLVLAPLFVLVSLLIGLGDGRPIFFRQERVGYKGKIFRIWKFRTMVIDAERQAQSITRRLDPRVTRVGFWLRQFKLDELPQLFNVLMGEMSLVGPRPEVRRYVELFQHDYEAILQVRPGITDLASLKYRDEARVLEQFQDPEEAYVKCILPDKIRLAKEYIGQSSFAFDLLLILRTLLKLVENSSTQQKHSKSSVQ